ncbi:HDOD domain-containing protein [Candidatus Latescibacterota bacterium]
MLSFFRKRKKNPKAELEEILGNYELPSFPSAVMSILTALRNPDFSMKEVAKQLEGDPGLHVKVLKTVNSAAFGLTTRVSNVHHAVTLLGRSRLETIVLSQAVNSTLPKVEMPFFDMRQFWLISAQRASLARVLANQLHPATQVESFTTGLLLDMALPILVVVRPKEYKMIFERWNIDKSVDLSEIEKDVLGYDHSFAGALIAENWDLPEYLIRAIYGHHSQDTDVEIEPAVELVSYLKGDDEDAMEKLVGICVKKYSMNEENVREMVAVAFHDAEQLSEIMR